MQYTTVVFMQLAVTETITSMESVTGLENPNYGYSYHSIIKATKTFFGGFSASHNSFWQFYSYYCKNLVQWLEVYLKPLQVQRDTLAVK